MDTLKTATGEQIKKQQMADMLYALWTRPSVINVVYFIIGSFLTWAAMSGYQAMQNRCQTYVVKFRILGGAPGQADAYITTTNESFYSFKEYKAGEEVCL